MAIRALKWPWMRFTSSALLPKPLLGAGASRKSSGCLAALTPSRQAFSSNGLSADAPASGPSETTKYSKHKTPRKRASSVLAELRRIEHSKSISANAAKNFPTFRAGDSIEVKMVTHLSSTEIDTYRGVVLGMRRNGADSRFLLADVFLGTPILNNIPLYSPFIKSLKVLQPAYIHKGKKRVRRSKLYYLWEKRDPKYFSIST
ncbi:50s ribosomal protein l19 [Nannochloropsis gaditana]|uniref:50S ribosomal protein L19, chloroplastic n=1 Tax=Nannochloropsis gaditana TaxID=72520 RepID=W7TTB2_9STRA|nr:50s ribosomal protein l19 [Nannochloropsis gaditana]